MSIELFRKYIDMINEAGEAAPAQAVSQQELAQLYPKGKAMNFIKNTPVALVPFANLAKYVGDEKAKEIASKAGAVDKTSYDNAYKQGSYVVFQWDSGKNQPDIYLASPQAVQTKYEKFAGQLPTDPKARGKIPSLVVLDKMGVDSSKIPFFVKKVPTTFIKARDVGLEGKKIAVLWGGQYPDTQDVASGGFLTREENGHIYTVAPDANGLPIGYIQS